MFTNMQNALNSQNMPKQMNLSKTLNLNELKEYQHMNQADFLQSDGDMALHQANTLNQQEHQPNQAILHANHGH